MSKDLKIIVTTSDAYLHIIPIFAYLFNKNWDPNQKVEIVGYRSPYHDLPPNFSFVSLGQQSGNKKDFSNDLRKHFIKQDEFFVWMMEDSFIKSVDLSKLDVLRLLMDFPNVGRINLTSEAVKQDHDFSGLILNDCKIYKNTQTAKYRLSTQPSIWNRDFLLKYLTPDLSPWEFETQSAINDGYSIFGFDRNNSPVRHNEGVRRFDIHKFNFDGMNHAQIEEMKLLKYI